MLNRLPEVWTPGFQTCRRHQKLKYWFRKCAFCWFIMYNYITTQGQKKKYVWINCKVVGKYNKVLYWLHGTHTESQEIPNSSGAVALTFIVLNRARPLEQVYWSSDVNFISLYNFRSKRSSLRQLANYIKDKRQTPRSSSRGLRYCHLTSIKTRTYRQIF